MLKDDRIDKLALVRSLCLPVSVADVASQDYAMSDLVQEKIMDAEMGTHSI